MKKRTGISLLVFLISSSFLGTETQAQSLNDSLKVWYKCDGNLADSSGFTHHLSTLSGASFTYVTDRYGNASSALRTIGSNGFKSGFFSSSSWKNGTVALWYKHEAHNNLQVLFQGREMGFGVVYRYPTSSMLQVGTFWDGSSAGQYPFPGAPVDTIWHHIVAVNDGNTTYAYLDGIFHGKISESFYAGTGSSLSALYLGCSNSGYPFKGSLDDVRLYNRVLSPCEVLNLYNGKACGCMDTTNVTVFDTTAVYDTTRIAIYDTIGVYDTTFISRHDTIDVFDTTFVTINDTTRFAVYDTTHITVYDTTSILFYDTLTVWDTLWVIDTTRLTLRDTLWTTVHDTLLIQMPDTGGGPCWIKVYPTPTRDKLTVDLCSPDRYLGYHLQFYNMIGQLIIDQEVRGRYELLDLRHLAQGHYILVLVDQNARRITTRRIVLY